MKNKIMTPEQYIEMDTGIYPISWRMAISSHDEWAEAIEEVEEESDDDIDIMRIMQDYAHYYAKALIESLTDEEIEDECICGFTPTAEAAAKWLKQELLKRNEG